MTREGDRRRRREQAGEAQGATRPGRGAGADQADAVVALRGIDAALHLSGPSDGGAPTDWG